MAALLLCWWSGLAQAQTAIDPYTVASATGSPCNGASSGGVFTCAISGVTAGDTLIIAETDNSGTLTPVCTETAHSTTLTPIKSTWQLSASAPAMWEGAWAILNASQTGYTISCNNSGTTQAQTIMVVEVHSSQGPTTIDESPPRVAAVGSDGGGPFVTLSAAIQSPLPSNGITITDLASSATATFVLAGSTTLKLYLNTTTGFASGDLLSGTGLLPIMDLKKNAASTQWIGGPNPGHNLAQAGELMVGIGGSVTTLTTLVSATGNSKAFVIPTGAKELTLPSMAISTTVAGDIALSGIGGAPSAGNFTASTSSASLTSVVDIKQATIPTIKAFRSNGSTPGEIVFGTDSTPVTNPTLANIGGNSTFASPLCAAIVYCVVTDGALTWVVPPGTVKALETSDSVQINNLCTDVQTPVNCCTGLGTGTCTAYDEILFTAIPTSCSGNIAACSPTIQFSGADVQGGTDYSVLFSGANGCNVAGTSSAATGTSTTITGPTHTGATAQSNLILGQCDFFQSSRTNPNPLFAGSGNGTGVGDIFSTVTFGDFYPIQVAGTAPAQVNTLLTSVPWIAGQAVMAGVGDPTPTATSTATATATSTSTPTATATPSGCIGSHLGRKKGLHSCN